MTFMRALAVCSVLVAVALAPAMADLDGTQLAMGAGAPPVAMVAAVTGAALQASGTEEPPSTRVFHKVLMREIIWFDSREADLEKHAFERGGQIFITLTDLIRHIGGTPAWGKSGTQPLAYYRGKKIRVVPGSSSVYVNGKAHSLGAAAVRIDSRTFVPVRPMLRALGLRSHWDSATNRLYVEVK